MNKRSINLIVLHCSATASGQSLQRGVPGKAGSLSPVQVIDAWHKERGFARTQAPSRFYNPTLRSIGYHFVIDTTGEVFTGRHLEEPGAHVAGMNANSIGICMVGGVEPVGRYTAAQWKSLAELVRWQCTENSIAASPARLSTQGTTISVTRPGVCGHRDCSPDLNHNNVAEPREWLKTCPGFDVGAWLNRGMLPERANLFDVPAGSTSP